jgi:hypothetical protein
LDKQHAVHSYLFSGGISASCCAVSPSVWFAAAVACSFNDALLLLSGGGRDFVKAFGKMAQLLLLLRDAGCVVLATCCCAAAACCQVTAVTLSRLLARRPSC